MTRAITAKAWRGFCLAVFSLMIMSLAAVLPAVAEDAAPTSPVYFVQKLGDTALMSLTAKNVDRKTREKRIRDILQNNFDIAAIGKFALGTYWREASEAQRQEYMSLFEDMIVQTYTTRFEDYSGQVLKVGLAKKAGEKDTLVNSQVLQEDGPPINLEWRVRNKDGLRIVDVVVEGVSMSVTQRSDFSAVIQRGGGNIDSLLTSLRDRKKAAASRKS